MLPVISLNVTHQYQNVGSLSNLIKHRSKKTLISWVWYQFNSDLTGIKMRRKAFKAGQDRATLSINMIFYIYSGSATGLSNLLEDITSIPRTKRFSIGAIRWPWRRKWKYWLIKNISIDASNQGKSKPTNHPHLSKVAGSRERAVGNSFSAASLPLIRKVTMRKRFSISLANEGSSSDLWGGSEASGRELNSKGGPSPTGSFTRQWVIKRAGKGTCPDLLGGMWFHLAEIAIIFFYDILLPREL